MMLSRFKRLVHLMQENWSPFQYLWLPVGLCVIGSLLSFPPTLLFVNLVYYSIVDLIHHSMFGSGSGHFYPADMLMMLFVSIPAALISGVLLTIAFLQGQKISQDPTRHGGNAIRIYTGVLISLNILSLLFFLLVLFGF